MTAVKKTDSAMHAIREMFGNANNDEVKKVVLLLFDAALIIRISFDIKSFTMCLSK